jgi:hypothetical protein
VRPCNTVLLAKTSQTWHGPVTSRRAHFEAMLAFAPRIPRQLLAALVRLDDRTLPIAEIYRRLGAEADRLRVTRPSYQRIRVLLHEARRLRRARPSTAAVLVDLAFRLRPPTAVLDHLAGIGVPPLEPRPP